MILAMFEKFTSWKGRGGVYAQCQSVVLFFCTGCDCGDDTVLFELCYGNSTGLMLSEKARVKISFKFLLKN